MTITSNSPLQSTPDIYLNDKYQTELFFTDNKPEYSYIVILKEGLTYKVIGYGKLSGRGNGIDNDYRFDFNTFIKIPKQEISITNHRTHLASFVGDNRSNLWLLINDSDVLHKNMTGGYISQLSNGEYVLDSSYIPSDLDCDYIFNYRFWDRASDTNFFIPSNVYTSEVLPVTIYIGVMYYTMYNGNTIINQSSFSLDSNIYRVGLLRIPANCTRVEFELRNGVTTLHTQTIFTQSACINNYYFFNPSGAFDILRCQGTLNEVSTTEKEEIKVRNSVVYTKLKVLKQLKQNSGLLLSDSQVRGLIQSPYVYKFTDTGSAITSKEYLIDNNSFEGYNGVSLGNKNIELIFTDPTLYERATNKNITFFD